MTKKLWIYRAIKFIPLCALVSGMLFAFYPLLVARFAVGDDYVYLWQISHLKQSADVYNKVVGEGRFIYAIIVIRLYGLFNAIDDLQSARLALFCLNAIAAIGIYARIGLLLFDDVRSKFLRQMGAMSLALGLVVMPGFQVLNSLAEALPYPMAILLALLAQALSKKTESTGGLSISILKTAGAILALVCALNIYQPLAMIFWIPAIIELCDIRKGVRERLAAFIRSFLIGAAALALAYLFLQATRGAIASRAALVFDIPLKLRWFFGELLPNALAMPLLQPERRITLGILLFMLIGLMLRGRGHLSETFLSLSAFGLCIFLCAIPNLVSAENSATYRSQVALEMAMGVFAVFALRGWGHLANAVSPGKRGEILSLTILAVVCAICVVICNRQTEVLIAGPQAYELGYLRASIQAQAQDIASNGKLTIVSARRSDGIAPRHLYDEFGIPSSFQTWYADAMARVVLEETTLQKTNIAVAALPSTSPSVCSGNSPCVDMRLMAGR